MKQYVSFDSALFRRMMRRRKITIRKLAEELDRSEGTVRIYFRNEAMPDELFRKAVYYIWIQ